MKTEIKIVNRRIKQEKRGFECKDATDCSARPYHLLSLNIASGDLVDSIPVVQVRLHWPIRWLNFHNFSPCAFVSLALLIGSVPALFAFVCSAGSKSQIGIK